MFPTSPGKYFSPRGSVASGRYPNSAAESLISGSGRYASAAESLTSGSCRYASAAESLTSGSGRYASAAESLTSGSARYWSAAGSMISEGSQFITPASSLLNCDMNQDLPLDKEGGLGTEVPINGRLHSDILSSQSDIQSPQSDIPSQQYDIAGPQRDILDSQSDILGAKRDTQKQSDISPDQIHSSIDGGEDQSALEACTTSGPPEDTVDMAARGGDSSQSDLLHQLQTHKETQSEYYSQV